MAESIDRSSRHFLDAHLLAEFLEEKLKRELGVSDVKIHLGSGPPRAAPLGCYLLRSGDRTLGFLEIRLPDFEFSAAEEAAASLLASGIAVALERCQLLESKLRIERELAHKSRMEELGRMAASVAHNVKNPLSSMKTLIQLLREATNLTQEQRHECEMMIEEVDRLSKTINNLLKFSRLESATASTQVNLHDLLDSLQVVFRGDLRSKDLTLATILDVSPPVIRSDADSLSDILGNLLSNAIEASNAGAGIQIDVCSKDGQVEISVEDEGPGIPPQVRNSLFTPFVTTKSRGTGLGLAIVKKRVEALGGTIQFTSPVSNAGTRFIVRLPS